MLTRIGMFIGLFLLYGFFSLSESPKAVVEIQPSIYHLGKVADSQSVSFCFTLVNNSDKEIKVEKIVTSCGCTVAKQKFDVLLPGQSGIIDFVFDPKGRKGYARWEILFYTNLPEFPILMATFDVTILKDGMLSQDFFSFGEFHRGVSADMQLWIAPEKNPDFKVKEVKVVLENQNQECFDVECKPGVYDGFYPGPRPAYSLKLVAKNNIPYGRIEGKVYIVTDIPGKEKIEIPLLAKVIGDIGLRPDYLALGAVKKEDKIVRKILIFNRKGESFQIQEIKTALPFLNLGYVSVLEDQYYQILVSIKKDSPLPSGEFRGKIVVTTSHPEMSEIEIPVQGVVIVPASEQK